MNPKVASLLGLGFWLPVYLFYSKKAKQNIYLVLGLGLIELAGNEYRRIIIPIDSVWQVMSTNKIL